MRSCLTFILIIILTLTGCVRSDDEEQDGLSASEIHEMTMHSDALEKDMKMSVYLPKGYSSSAKYPVLYIIHGYSGSYSDSFTYWDINKTADRLIAEGKIEPVIIVSPQLDNSFGINSSVEASSMDGDDPQYARYEGRYEDYIMQELLPFIDEQFSTSADKEHRWIGGISMGGFISLHTAFRHPASFSKVGGHSPALYLDHQTGYSSVIRWLYPDEEARAARDPLQLAKSANLEGMEIYLDCGDKDGYQFYQGAAKLDELLKKRQLQSEYHLYPGEHDHEYWRTHLEEYLLFYAGTKESMN